MKSMSMSIIIFTILCVAFPAFLPGESEQGAAASSILKQLFNGPYPFHREKNSAQASIPVELGAGLSPADIAVHVFKVVFNKEEQVSLLSQFQAELKEADKNNPLQLLISMAYQGRGKRYGDYDLYLNIAAKEKRETLLLQLQYPEAQLLPISPLHLQRVRFFGIPGLDTVSQHSMYLQIKEGMPVQEPFVYQAGSAIIGDVQVTGNLGFKSPISRDEGRIAEIPMSIASSFPLGKATGKIAVTSPDFQDTQVDFSVTTRWNNLLIFVIAFVAILLGHFLRVELASRLTRKLNMLQYGKFLQQVRESIDKGKEKVFNETLAQLEEDTVKKLKELEDATGNMDEATLKTEFQALQTRLQAAIAQLDNAITTAGDDANKLQVLLTRAYELPTSMENVLLTAGKQLEKVDRSLQQKDIDSAKSLLDQVLQVLQKDLETGYKSWYRSVEDQAKALCSDLQYRLPVPVETKISQPLTQFHQDSQTLMPGNLNDRFVAIETLLKGADTLFQQAVQLFEILTDDLVETATELWRALSTKNDTPQDQQFLDKLIQERNRLREISIQACVDDPDKNIPTLAQQVSNVTRQFFMTIQQIASKSIEENREEVRLQAEKGNYMEAVQAISQPDQPSPNREVSRRDSLLGGTPAAVGIPSLTLNPPLPPHTSYKKKNLNIFQNITRLFQTPLLQEKPVTDFAAPQTLKKIRREIHKDKLIQSLTAGFGLAIVGWFVFQPNFTGTANDLLSIFLWGFTSDLAVNTFVEKVKEVIKV